MEGYIKLYRPLIESKVFANQKALKIWIWCLLKANHKERFLPFKTGKGEQIISILPGQFLFGRFKAEEELNIDGSTIRRWLRKFEAVEFGMLSIETNSQFSIVTICNWGKYQSNETENEQPMVTQCISDAHSTNTNKNVKNDKKKKRSAVNFKIPTIEEIKSYCQERKNCVSAETFFNHYESNGWMVGKTGMKDWRAAIRSWESRSTPPKDHSESSHELNTPEAWKG